MTYDDLQAQNAELRLRLEEAEETLRAIQSGAVDAFVVEQAGSHRVYTLEAADRPYRLFVERMHQGAATLQADGSIVYCNGRLADLLQVPSARLLGSTLDTYVEDDDLEVYERLLQQAEIRSSQGEVRLKCSVGSPVPVYLTFSALPNDYSRLIGVLVTDLTTQKQHQQLAIDHQALRESDGRFRKMANAAPAMLWVTDAAGMCTFLSSGWYEYTGQTEAEGLDVDWLSVAHPDDREAARAAFLAANERQDSFSLDYRICRADGVYRWVIDAGRPRYDAAGRFQGYVGSVIEVHDRRLYEELLRESEERFRMLGDNMAQLAWTCDYLGEVTWYNQRWFDYTGRTFDDMRDWGWRELCHPDHIDRVVQGILRARQTGEVWEDTFPLRGEDGQYRWFLTRAMPILDEHGNIRRWFGTNTDVTDLISMEQALKEGDRRKDEFLAVLAHELRNPLAPIRNALSIQRIAAQHDPAADRVHQMLERQVNHMVRLIDDLMEVSRITRGKIYLRKESVEVATIMRSAVETSRPLIDAAGHVLEIATPPEPVIVDGDPVRLAQVLSNLLNNAAKYTEPGGSIWFTASHDAGFVSIRVRDSGMGIPADMLPRVFDLFTQLDRRADRAQGGLGIGLALVKSLVEMHGGSVAAHSEGIGRGTEFVVRLPLARVQSRGDVAVVEAPASPTARSRVLVVDDNRDSADSLGMLLELFGADVRIAYSGIDALDAYASYQPAIVMLDIGMPEMDGHEVARRIRNLPRADHVRLIALTGWGQEEDRQRSREAGFDAHLVKPVDLQVLRSLVASLDAR